MPNSGNHATGAEAEQRALRLGMACNLVLGLAGVTASILSNSQAILVDGLFSMVGFGAAAIALRVSARALQGPDKIRPLGYAMDEAIFSTFRAFILFGLVVFAGVAALLRIVNFFRGSAPPVLEFGPIGIYMAGVLTLSGGMWLIYRRAWINTGRKSDILRLESSAVAFDALMTVAAGLGFGVVYVLQDGPLGFLAPIGDSLIVLGLCGLAAASYFSDFKRGVGELAGVTADPNRVLLAGRALREELATTDVRLIDFSVLKSGRLWTVIVYLDPKTPITGEQVDALTLRLNKALTVKMGHVEVIAVISQHGRRLPAPEHVQPDVNPR